MDAAGTGLHNDSAAPRQLTWALMIATYNRRDTLLRTLDFAMRQTRLPIEIIVIDGSSDWAQTRQTALETIAPRHPHVRWEYRPANRLNVSAQRNQGFALVTADVAFALDDDTWMFPDAAERILRVYEADPERKIAGLMPLLTGGPPADPAATDIVVPAAVGAPSPPPSPPRAESSFKGMGRHLQRMNDLVKGPMLPPELNRTTNVVLPPLGTSVNQVQALHGCRMTFRKEVAQGYPFDENMQYLHEETEMCLRAKAAGAILQVHEPLMFHAKAAGQLNSRSNANQRRRWLLSHAYVCRKLGGRTDAMHRFVCQYNRRMRLADLAYGLAKRNLAFYRGGKSCWADVNTIMTAPDDRYAAVYIDAVKRGNAQAAA